MLRATLKSLLSRKLRLILSGLAVVLGVMFVSGAFVLTATLGQSFDSLFSTIYSTVDVQVAGPRQQAAEGAGLTATQPVPDSLLARVRAVPGVKTATGSVFVNGARTVGHSGKVVAGQSRFGANWTGDSGLVQLRSGRGPTAPDEIAINTLLAKAGSFHLGEQVGVLTREPKKTFTIVGIFGYSGDRDSIAGEQVVAFTTPVAQQLMLGRTGVYSTIDVTAARGVSTTKLRDDIRAALGSGYEVKTGAELAKQQANQIKDALKFVNYVLLGFAGVALFVGVFLILNTFSIIVASRTQELALMRAIGASRRQMIGSVIVEAVLVGFIAAVLGLGAGIGIGALLALVLGGGLGGIPVSGLAVPASAVIAAFLVGVLVTLVAAILPAVRASRVPPIAAMREAQTADKPLTALTVTGSVVTAAGCAALWFALSGNAHGNTLPALGVGLLLAFIGVALLTPAISRPVVSLLGRLFSWSMPGQLGRRNSARNPRRTAITAAALMVGIALITGVSVILTSAKISATKAFDTGVHAELIVAGQQTGAQLPTFDPAALSRMRAIDGVRAVLGVWTDAVAVDGKPTFAAAVDDTAALGSVLGLKATAGSLDALRPGRLLVDDKTASDSHLKVGSTVSVGTAGRATAVPYTVAGIYAKDTVAGYILDVADAATFRQPNPSQAYLQLVPGTDVAKVRNQVDALLADSPEVTVQDRSSYVQQQTRILDTILNIIQVLLAMAIIIAVLGVVNTLALSMIERTRELGLLRAVGMGRGQVMRMVTVESVVISLFGALLGIAVGCGLGVAVVRALKDQGFSDLGFPWSRMAVYLVLAALVGVVAAIVPAIRAARTNVLDAIAYE